MRVLILEDDGERVDQFCGRFNNLEASLTFVKTAEACIETLKNGSYDLICLDHDLGGDVFVDSDEKNTGSEVARYIEANPHLVEGSEVVIHSWNPAGAEYMAERIPNAVMIPSFWTEDVFREYVSTQAGTKGEQP